MAVRPSDKQELQKREAIGVIRASRFVRKHSRSRKPITIGTICEIRQEIFKKAWPDIAGIYREENLKITDSSHHPPHFSEVPNFMKKAEEDLQERLKKIERAEGIIQNSIQDENLEIELIDQVIRVAAWLHHLITFVHPFRDGNGRTARLAANLILESHGLVGLSIKVEQQNKNSYRKALAQIDQHEDFEPLVELVYDGLIDRYNGVAIKYYNS